MANNGPVITPPASAVAPPDAAAHNAEVAAKLAAQDIMGQSSAPQFNSDADAALDKLAQQVRPDPEAAKAAEEAAAAKAAEEAAADPAAAKAAEEAAAEAKKSEEAAAAQKAEEAE